MKPEYLQQRSFKRFCTLDGLHLSRSRKITIVILWAIIRCKQETSVRSALWGRDGCNVFKLRPSSDPGVKVGHLEVGLSYDYSVISL